MEEQQNAEGAPISSSILPESVDLCALVAVCGGHYYHRWLLPPGAEIHESCRR